MLPFLLLYFTLSQRVLLCILRIILRFVSPFTITKCFTWFYSNLCASTHEQCTVCTTKFEIYMHTHTHAYIREMDVDLFFPEWMRSRKRGRENFEIYIKYFGEYKIACVQFRWDTYAHSQRRASIWKKRTNWSNLKPNIC